ncbi:MFS transporter [Hamadaea sp.]|uniref:MFS transporter n=1 Tax=Hamadaea sp. TaxID=2024425 RepID=UPI0025BDD258|nr:MFS transporter [Hamadaea sp.]
MAQFMVVLDIAIVNVALPSIERDIGVGPSALQWIVIAYGLTLGGFLLLGGRLADLLGRRRVLITGLVLFTLASLVAGVSGSAGLLIAARAAQGFGAALIPPAALSILAVTFSANAERARAIGLYGATAGVSASVGVVSSGLLADGPGWRWIFFINVPIGIALVIAAAAFLTAEPRGVASGQAHQGHGFDVAGAVTGTAGLLLLLYGVNRGADLGWSSALTLGLFAAAVVSLVAFVAIERRSQAPLVPGVAVRNRTLVAANISAFFTFAAFFAFIFLGSLLMQQVLGYSAVRTGVAWLATTAISFVAAAVTGGKLVTRFGVRPLLIVGQALLALALLLLTRVPADAHYLTDLLPALLLAGIAGGIAAPAAQIGALSGVRPTLSGLASGLVETAREIGGAVGVAAVATVLVSASGVDAFHRAFWIVFAIAAAGAVSAGTLFPRPARHLHDREENHLVTTTEAMDTSTNGFTVTFTVTQTPAEVYAAVIDPRAWWSRGIDGSAAQAGDEFDYRYLDVHRCRIRIVEAVPGQRVTWHVVDNSFNFVKDDTEWVGTDTTFDISADSAGTRLVFTHHGLVPELECYDACSNGWAHYIGESLRGLIVTGEGQPNDADTAYTEFERQLRASLPPAAA